MAKLFGIMVVLLLAAFVGASHGPWAAPASAGLSCTTGSKVTWATNGHQYQVVCPDAVISWDAAKAAAEGAGGHLVTITTAAENSFVASLTSIKAWIGAKQASGSAEPDGGFAWVTGEAFSYHSFHPWEPNNCHAPGCTPEEAVAINDGGSGMWNDLPAAAATSDVSVYVVEFEEDTPEPPGPPPPAACLNSTKVTFRGHEYQVICLPGGLNTWWDANNAATFLKGSLAAINDREELDFVFGLANNAMYWRNDGVGQMGPFLGGHQFEGAAEPGGDWRWAGGGPWGYTRWAPGQPDNGGGAGPENFLAFWTTNPNRTNTWADFAENTRSRAAVIEWLPGLDMTCTPSKVTWPNSRLTADPALCVVTGNRGFRGLVKFKCLAGAFRCAFQAVSGERVTLPGDEPVYEIAPQAPATVRVFVGTGPSGTRPSGDFTMTVVAEPVLANVGTSGSAKVDVDTEGLVIMAVTCKWRDRTGVERPVSTGMEARYGTIVKVKCIGGTGLNLPLPVSFSCVGEVVACSFRPQSAQVGKWVEVSIQTAGLRQGVHNVTVQVTYAGGTQTTTWPLRIVLGTGPLPTTAAAAGEAPPTGRTSDGGGGNGFLQAVQGLTSEPLTSIWKNR